MYWLVFKPTSLASLRGATANWATKQSTTDAKIKLDCFVTTVPRNDDRLVVTNSDSLHLPPRNDAKSAIYWYNN